MQSAWLQYQLKELMMQNETILIISIFQKAYPLGPIAVSPEEFLDDFGFEIDRMGRGLKYLGLARDAARSDLGWKPAPLLMKIIAERVACPPVRTKNVGVGDESQNFVPGFMARATGDVPDATQWTQPNFAARFWSLSDY
jgi:hypothetical protein